MTVAGDRRGAAYDKRRRLAGELRVLRDMSGVSGRELAQRIGISQSKVSRIEVGAAQPSSAEIIAWARAVGAPEEIDRLLAALADVARTETDTWQAALEGRHQLQDDVREREATARRVRVFQPALVPGLLQTPAYAQRVFTMFKSNAPQTSVAAAVAARLDRQLALYDDDRHFEFLLTEAALRWRPGPARMMVAQLDRIAMVGTLDNVSIGLIPFAGQAEAPHLQGVSLFDDGDGDEDGFAMIELEHAWLTVTAADEVAVYRNRWSTLWKTAVFGDEARTFLHALAAEMRAIED
jgi:transcriptional regulator with XRE-family HTH domain